MGVRICRNHIQATLEIWVLPFILSHWYRAYLCLASFKGRILLNYHLSKARHDLWSIGMPIKTWYYELDFSYTWFLKNTSTAWAFENKSSQNPTSKDSLDTGNPNRSTTSLSVQGSQKASVVQKRVHMRYHCFCKTLASMLWKFNINF